MNTQFTKEELQNLLVLIGRANITGQEAAAVTFLQQKISALLKDEPQKPRKDLGSDK